MTGPNKGESLDFNYKTGFGDDVVFIRKTSEEILDKIQMKRKLPIVEEEELPELFIREEVDESLLVYEME